MNTDWIFDSSKESFSLDVITVSWLYLRKIHILEIHSEIFTVKWYDVWNLLQNNLGQREWVGGINKTQLTISWWLLKEADRYMEVHCTLYFYLCLKFSIIKSLKRNCLVVQWLGLGVFIARARVLSLVRELRSRMPRSLAK